MKRPLLFLLLASISGLAPVRGADILSPQPGTPLRQAILDDLRASEPTASIMKEKKQKVAFEKVTLRVAGEWAWISASPRTADNNWHSEPLTGLMRHQGGHWKVVEYISDTVSSAGNPQAAYQAWRAELLKKNPECPPGLVPSRE